MANRKKYMYTLAIMLFSAFAVSACSSPYQTRTEDVSSFDRVEIRTFGEFIIEQ
jgi:hypothetical protein